MVIWDKLKTPPPEALKPIKGGRLKGMTDISPQWRYQALTEEFGPCGIGWRYEITKLWLEPDGSGLITAFATINFSFHDSDRGWSEPIPGIGGSMYVAKESSGPHTSDEAYKMAVTDALGVAVKMLGVASDVYMGNMDGSKYKNNTPHPKCRKCGKSDHVYKGKEENGGGWFCWKKKGGCGEKWVDEKAPLLTSNQQGNVEGWIAVWNTDKKKGADPKAWWEEKSKGIVSDCGKEGAESVLEKVKA